MPTSQCLPCYKPSSSPRVLTSLITLAEGPETSLLHSFATCPNGTKDRYSWGFGGTATKSHAGNFEKFGQTFGKDDAITCCVDLEPWYVLLRSFCFSFLGGRLGQ